ncbi:hypothetical protein COLO4_11979 [Corchorus olitorius]|uniref:Uncharacterized protein n=1 Tax=Corchorus olitorius TaxID=93759 RepID=A0A1R3K2K1_9ROSI|nr:hypothetical protein COLO4_11979 [Corchorus olitorius]
MSRSARAAAGPAATARQRAGPSLLAGQAVPAARRPNSS